jgi:hypothetical protein
MKKLLNHHENYYKKHREECKELMRGHLHDSDTEHNAYRKALNDLKRDRGELLDDTDKSKLIVEEDSSKRKLNQVLPDINAPAKAPSLYQ